MRGPRKLAAVPNTREDTVVTVPEGRSNYFQRVDVSDTLNVVVDFEAVLDPNTRELTVTLTSLDPQTFDYPLDPFAGFLPPNVTAPEGDGFIRFSVQPQADLTEGTRIDAVARIVFDTEAPIDTPDVHNIIDNAAPSSSVLTLPTATGTADFVVEWSGEDGLGSGIRSFDVFVSIDEGPFEVWLDDTTSMEFAFSAEPGHTYALYSVATDNVGRRELAPVGFDTKTIVTSASWQNPINQFDVSANGHVAAEDLLALLTYLNAYADDPSLPALPASPPPFLDVNDDGWCTPLDLLTVITHINRQAGSGGEGEFSTLYPNSAYSYEFPADASSSVTIAPLPPIYGELSSGHNTPPARRSALHTAGDRSTTMQSSRSGQALNDRSEGEVDLFSQHDDVQDLDELLACIAQDIDHEWQKP